MTRTAPAARGILFSRPMVEALLAGTKTQTRRAVRPRPRIAGADADAPAHNPFGQPGDRLWVRERFFAYGHWQTRHNARKGREEWFFTDLTRASGQTWRYEGDAAGADPDAAPDAARIAGAAPAWHPRNALFMPRAASRILLEIVDVRSEPLQAIGAADAIAEGIRRVGDGYALPGEARTTRDPVRAYRAVWEAINGPGSWEADPLVWVLGFRRLGF